MFFNMKNNLPVISYRISHFLYYHHFKSLSRIMDWLNRLVFACFVPGQAQIGANSVINKDVPDNAVVAGNPFRIIRIIDSKE